ASTSNHTAIGYYAGWVVGNSNEIEVGNTSVAFIGGQVGWSSWSDKRIKDNIQNNVPGLSFITKLNPVTYKLNIHRQN
ncbi:tail fiber domain-containing protein, partial [Rhizobium leguminosarum]|uniref:tail fiber domain-containing protein n=1 Tax=Rhizobium leguminosarum TaxID=384 RepID=UPI003F95EA26